MLKAAATIEQIAREAGEFLSKYIRVDKLILYGSYIYGQPREDSDFDLVVISEDFEQMPILEKMELFSKAALAIDCRVELKGFGKKEFLHSEQGSFLEFIKNKGKVIFSLR